MDERFGGLIWTKHALAKLSERRIAQSDAWYTFKHPDKQLRGKVPGSWRYCKSYKSQKIELVAIKNKKGEWVVLSCWSKLIGDGRPTFPKRENTFRLLSKIIWKRFKF